VAELLQAQRVAGANLSGFIRISTHLLRVEATLGFETQPFRRCPVPLEFDESQDESNAGEPVRAAKQ
jgi:hypothetical protein